MIKFETQVVRRPRLQKWWKSRSFDVIQLIVFTGALVWLTLRGANSMNYVWQWHRMPQYLYKIIDGEFILGPLVDGLFAVSYTHLTLPTKA